MVDPTILEAFNIIDAEQENITQATAKAVTQLLNYSATHSEAITRYHASGIFFHVHFDASFLSEPEVNIRAVGYHYLSTQSAYPSKPPINHPPLNGPVHVQFTTMCNALSSTIKA